MEEAAAEGAIVNRIAELERELADARETITEMDVLLNDSKILLANATRRAERAEAALAEARKDAWLRHSISRAAGVLPEGCEIQIIIECGAATVEWFDSQGVRHEMDIDSDRRLECEFDAAIDAALAAEKGEK